jgi:NH3-dependent NAD+ synthetase
MVLSTDNYTEYLLGFWTLHGDVGDFGMIQNLWKTEVYGLAEYLVKKFNLLGQYKRADTIKKCIDAVPTDGLGVTDSDFDQILPDYDKNMSPKEIYQEIDETLRLRLSAAHDRSEVVKRFRATEFKRNNPFNIPRKYIIR